MDLRVVFALLGLVACGSCKPLTHNVTLPLCNSPEAEAGAQVALDFINAQHTNGYKYTLNQIEDIKAITKADGTHTYFLELEFLETKCHVYDPSPVPLCEVRPKIETAVEADCDVALSEAGGQFSVIAFKCKTELETVDHCVGCPYLQPLNYTEGNQLVQASLKLFNKNNSLHAVFALREVGRLSSQVVSRGHVIRAEYAIIEINCTSVDDDICVPLDPAVAHHGLCHSEGYGTDVTVSCKTFPPGNVTLPAPPSEQGLPSTTHGFKHHKLTALHDPGATGLLSTETESAEKAPIVKRTVGDPQPNGVVIPDPVLLLPRCPGKIINF